MPQITRCPDCERKLRVPDHLLGKKVRCPGCSVMFQANPEEDELEETDEESDRRDAAPTRRKTPARDSRIADSPRAARRLADREEEDRQETAPRRRRSADDDDDEEEEDRRPAAPRRRRSEDEEDDYEERGPSLRDQKAGWGKVRLGIHLLMIGTWAWLAGLTLGGLGGLLSVVLLGGAFLADSQQGGMTSLGFAGILALLSVALYALGAFAELVLRLVGYGLCMAVPPRRETGLKPLAIAAFALAAVSLLCSLLNIGVGGASSFVPSVSGRSGANLAGNGLSAVGGLCGFASFIVYLFFLRSVCNNARARDLAGSPITVLIAFISYYVVAALIMGILLCAGGYAFFTAFRSQSADTAGKSVGAWAIISGVVLFIVVVCYLGLHIWYVMVLQKIRDAVASYRRRL